MVKFYGAVYSQSIKRSLPSDRVYYKCNYSESKSVKCAGQIEFGVDREGRNNFNRFLDYRSHTRSCTYYYTNESLERLLKRSRRPRSPEQERKRHRRSSSSRDRHALSNENGSRTGEVRDRKEADKVQTDREEKSEMFDLFKTMYDFETTLKSLIQYSDDQRNRSYIKARIDHYQKEFERLMSQFRTSDALDKSSVSFKLISSSAPVSSSSDSPSIAKSEPAAGKASDSESNRSKEMSPECRSPIGELKSIDAEDLRNHRRSPAGELKIEMEEALDPSGDYKVHTNEPRFETEVLDDGRINLYI